MATTVEEKRETTHLPPPRAHEPAAPPKRRIPRAAVFAIIGVVVLLGLVWVYRKWSYARVHESTENAQIDGHIVPVLARVQGYVAQVRVGENDSIHAGDTLVILDDAEFRAKLAQATADLAAAQAAAGSSGATGQAQAELTGATRQQSVLESQIDAERSNAVRARADLARYEQLAARQIVSQSQLDAARNAVQTADARVQALERQLSAAGAGIAGAEAGVKMAQARLLAARAARDNAALQLGYTHITAPDAGIVSHKQVEPGQLVQPGQPLMAVVSDTGVWVTANFKETQLATIRVGEPVDIDVDAYGGCVAQGRVESISSATGARFALLPPENATGNFTKVVQHVPVRIAITQGCGAAQPLRPGLSVVVHVHTG